MGTDRIGLIGCGWIAPFHLTGLRQADRTARIAWLADPNPDRATLGHATRRGPMYEPRGLQPRAAKRARNRPVARRQPRHGCRPAGWPRRRRRRFAWPRPGGEGRPREVRLPGLDRPSWPLVGGKFMGHRPRYLPEPWSDYIYRCRHHWL